jgi:hypothetical protein
MIPHTFVANGSQITATLSKAVQWRYLNTKHNPVNDASRVTCLNFPELKEMAQLTRIPGESRNIMVESPREAWLHPSG